MHRSIVLAGAYNRYHTVVVLIFSKTNRLSYSYYYTWSTDSSAKPTVMPRKVLSSIVVLYSSRFVLEKIDTTCIFILIENLHTVLPRICMKQYNIIPPEDTVPYSSTVLLLTVHTSG